jgi:hypothetical protein
MAAYLMVFVGNTVFVTKPTFAYSKMNDSFTQNTICVEVIYFNNEHIRASQEHTVFYLGLFLLIYWNL